MKWMLSVIFAVSMLVAADAYDGSFNESLYGYISETPYEGEYSTPYKLWIVEDGQMTQYLQCPLRKEVRMIAYSPGGSGTISEIYPDGRQTRNFYQFEAGNTELTFVAYEPGGHTLGYEINGQMSNVVIIDVFSYGGEAAGPIYSSEVNHPPEIHSLNATSLSGYPGAIITFTADASDQDGDPILYKFWMATVGSYCPGDQIDFSDYQPITDWTRSNSCTWYPQESDYGYYAVMVDVRDGSHQPPESWDDFNETEIIEICHKDPSLVGNYEAGCPPSICMCANSRGKVDRKASRPKTLAEGSKKTSGPNTWA